MHLGRQILAVLLLGAFWAPTISAVTLRIHYPTGFGRHIAVRGNVSPLRWDVGLPARWTEGDIWIWEGPPTLRQFELKPLLDDRLWSTGGSYEALLPFQDEVLLSPGPAADARAAPAAYPDAPR